MHVSEARIRANQANGARSKGPVTDEGKSISRRNGLKHGMTGQGVVVLEEDQAEIDARIEAFTSDLKPMSAAGVLLIAQMATLSVREERSTRHELAAIAHRVRHAADDFDEERIEHAQELFEALPKNPRQNLRKLKKSPEGIDRLIEAWEDFKADLAIKPEPRWTVESLVLAANMTGLKADHARGSALGDLSEAFWTETTEANKKVAVAKLIERIDAEIASLESHFETLDLALIELDRAEAGGRALFDPSKPAILARRYEAEARRGFFKALKEFRLVEAEFARTLEAAPTPPKAPPAPRAEPRMGSDCQTAPRVAPAPSRNVPEPPTPRFSNAIDRDGQFVRMIPASKPPG